MNLNVFQKFNFNAAVTAAANLKKVEGIKSPTSAEVRSQYKWRKRYNRSKWKLEKSLGVTVLRVTADTLTYYEDGEMVTTKV
jgi:hypothetical protein